MQQPSTDDAAGTDRSGERASGALHAARAPAAPRRGLRRLVDALLLALVLLLLAEEWLWSRLRALSERLASVAVVRTLQRQLLALPPVPSVLLLGLPALLIVPVKLLAAWTVVHGHPVLGLSVLLAAKLVGTAILAWLYGLVGTQARKVRSFDRLVSGIDRLLATCRAWLRRQPAWRRVVLAGRRLRRYRGSRSPWARRWRAARVVGRRWRDGWTQG